MENLLPPKLLCDTTRITTWKREQPVQWKKRTIEFRQHEGTLDSDSIAIQVMAMAGPVEYAQNVDDMALEELLAQHLALERNSNEGNHRIVQLLRDIRLEKPAAFYEKRFGDRNAHQEKTRKSGFLFKVGNPTTRPWISCRTPYIVVALTIIRGSKLSFVDKEKQELFPYG